jgi:hypothetical protein
VGAVRWSVAFGGALVFAMTAAAGSLPAPEEFAAQLRAMRISLDRFDFSAAGYWDLAPNERLLWYAQVQPLLADAPTDITSCDADQRRRYMEGFWLVQALQSADAATWKSRTSAVRERLAAMNRELAALRPPRAAGGPRVRELRRRYLLDQAIRNPANSARWRADLPPGAEMLWNATEYTNSIAVDCDNTEWLSAQLRDITWFDVPTYGAEADSNAFFLVQHADRSPEFQRAVLSALVHLPPDKTARRNVAFLTDRVALGSGKPQQYGTQGRCSVDGDWKPSDIQDEANVDDRRRAMGLGTISERIAEMSRECAPAPSSQPLHGTASPR